MNCHPICFSLGLVGALITAGCAANSQAQGIPAGFQITSQTSVAGAGALPAEVSKPECQAANFKLDVNFPSGAMQSCEVIGASRIKVTIAPEDDGEINNSAWYAFRLTPVKAGRVTVEMHYKGGDHRYWPKTSPDGQNWTQLPAKAVHLKEPKENKKAVLKIKLGAKPLLVAGQEIIVPATYDAWLSGIAKSEDVMRFTLGKSKEGRPIPGALIRAVGSVPKEQIVLIGRQHPPEVTGALAMLPFVEALLSDDPIAKRYRERFETYVIPMLNPDGVVHGHWRHNSGGTDLNRDWGPFKQPETRLLDELLRKIADDPDRQLRFFVDFHSTQNDVFYTIPDANPTNPEFFIRDWLARMQERLPKYEINRDQNHNAATTVSKAYVYETYGVPAVTYELGDETDRKLIRRTARESAIAMMETLLNVDQP